MRTMERHDFFPRLRDGRQKDPEFARLFLQPSSFHRATNDPGVSDTRETNGDHHEKNPRVSDKRETKGDHENDPRASHTGEKKGDHERFPPKPKQPSFQTVGNDGDIVIKGAWFYFQSV